MAELVKAKVGSAWELDSELDFEVLVQDVDEGGVRAAGGGTPAQPVRRAELETSPPWVGGWGGGTTTLPFLLV